jgi:hypothetical protein
MPKLSCLCGAVINLSGIPQRGAFDVLPEVVREPLIDTIGQLVITPHHGRILSARRSAFWISVARRWA